jgi:guanosine-3',5'-bis(diphosphate) 3'-pyrophosphohydrolase
MEIFCGNDIGFILSAIKFSAEKHRNQRRKDADLTPYINHPIEVAELLWRVGQVRRTEPIIAALLHDIIEDTDTEPREIRDLFGEEVLRLVHEVSDDKSLPKAERKRLQIERARYLSYYAKHIKLADKICNVRDITHAPPRNWSIARRLEYVEWTQRVIDGLRGCNQALELCYDEAFHEAVMHIRR